MVFFRRRFLFWVLKEYIRRSGRAILLFFVLGIIGFFTLRFLLSFLAHRIPFGAKEVVGFAGAYTLSSLPESVLSDVASGLTHVEKDGSIKPDVASSWKILNNGKEYVFFLEKGVRFSDNELLTSSSVSYDFNDVSIEKLDPSSIVFKLKDPYAPFLTSVSNPFFKKGFIGVGSYTIKDVKLNGDFVKSITLLSANHAYAVKKYEFYPSEDALKLAFALGEISKAKRLSSLSFKDTSIKTFSKVTVSQYTDYSKLITLFFNTTDPIMSDKRLRQSLSFALPAHFSFGERAYAPFPTFLWAYQKSVNEPEEDLERAKLLLSASSVASSSSRLTIEVKVLSKYVPVAKKIGSAWKLLNLETKITPVEDIPSQFQIFLGDFNVPKDPDQYSLWHSDQENNITRYRNLRIDKLLEDGRKTVDLEKRRAIYADFLKYLLDDPPASFLYFPYRFDVARK